MHIVKSIMVVIASIISTTIIIPILFVAAGVSVVMSIAGLLHLFSFLVC